MLESSTKRTLNLVQVLRDRMVRRKQGKRDFRQRRNVGVLPLFLPRRRKTEFGKPPNRSFTNGVDFGRGFSVQILLERLETRKVGFYGSMSIHGSRLRVHAGLLRLFLDPVVPLLFQLEGKVFAARLGDTAIDENMNEIGNDIIQ